MKIIVLLLIFFLPISLRSQIPVESFTHALKSKQFSTFETTFKKALKKDSLIDYGNRLAREIFGDYKEVFYEINDRYPLIGNNHSLKMIIKGNRIIYYNFSYVNVEKKGENRIFTTVIIDSFIDVSNYNIFKTAFKKIYHANLSESDLWRFNLVGQFCGLMVTIQNIKEYDEMEKFIKTNQRDSLLGWLQSANLERQMFGLWAYNRLIQKKETLTSLESKLIRVVIAKKAKGHVCGGGCDAYYLTPREFAKEYKLNKLPL